MAKFSTVHDADDHTGVSDLFDAVETDHDSHDHTGVPGVGGASSILQVVTATLAGTDVSTTSTTFQDSGLAATITPVAGDSLLIVTVMGECRAHRAAGTITNRFMWVAIRNDTDGVMLTEQVRGRNLSAASAGQAEGFWPIALQAFYTVDDTDPRTFKLQYKSGEATNTQAFILTASPRNVATMVIMEIAA